MNKKSKKTKLRPRGHTFYFKLQTGKTIKAVAKVRPASKVVELTLTKEHVARAIELGGQGNTQDCAMAVCSREHGTAFPDPFDSVDWLYNRAYFVTKVKNGMPTECVVYTHHDNIAPMFDTVTGMRKLMKVLEREGAKTIKLYPPKPESRTPRANRTGNRTGEMKRTQSRGAALRFARMRSGGAPEAAR